MSDTFNLSTTVLDGRKIIRFANKSDDFVEVIFTIDGCEIKDGNPFDFALRGYGYPPKLERAVKCMRDGAPLPFHRGGGEVKAYIFAGKGAYYEDDLRVPAFMRKRVVSHMKFQRIEKRPAMILQCSY